METQTGVSNKRATSYNWSANTVHERKPDEKDANLKRNKTEDITEVPSSEQIESFWKSIWSTSTKHATDSAWIHDEYKRSESIKAMEDATFSEADIKKAVESTQNWRAAGPDAEKICTHLETHNILAIEQKGCVKNSKGCKEQLIIDTVIMEQAYHNQRNIYTSYIDFKKAFNTVPHSWLLEVLDICKISPNIKRRTQQLMNSWKVTLKLFHNNGLIKTAPIPIKRGIFQGDSLSPIWFCLALNPLSSILNASNYGFSLKAPRVSQYRLSHLLYVDDIKLYAANERQMNTLLEQTEDFSNDIKMSFGVEKYRRLSVENGKLIRREFELMTHETVDSMTEGNTYKYLAINAFAIPVLTYTFGVVKWSETELENVKRATRTLLTKYGTHHPKSAVERLYLPRRQGDRGMVDIKQLHNKCKQSLRLYFHNQENSLLQTVCKADLKYSPLNLSEFSAIELISGTQHIQSLMQDWKMKAVHGRYPHALDAPEVDNAASNEWLIHSGIYAETEGFMIAIQDQVIATRNYSKYIMRASVENDLCRRCQKQTETIHHITGACVTLAATEYLTRHNQVAKIVHQSLAIQHKLVTEELPYFKYTPDAVIENRTSKLYWDRSVLTDHPMPHNRPDIIGVPNTHNLQDCYMEKYRKYQSLAYEIKDLWKLEKVEVIPVIISTTGVIPKSLNTSLEKLNMVEKRRAIQKSVILSISSIIRKFLNIN
ncbi:uncharacterized protein LOC118757459 [Rhagoletis pomonella]|uniref:uncharacterized protein LOC118757459 n=1 Tax=Rhagoletis pomonella TaxID=28610 RepID=UPI0017837BE5|nr:uncharacterized protein LOC118757459 [Rhagoletis pomonella]